MYATQAMKPDHDPLCPTADAIIESTGKMSDAWCCKKCGTYDLTRRASADPALCNDCYKLEAQNTAVAKKTNSDWMEQSTACGLAIYERQPEETNNEWFIWDKYRSHYPGKMPNWTQLADECGCAVATVLSAANKWSFKVRIQAWARAMDDTLQETRIATITEMNNRQVEMATMLQEKLKVAIDGLQPELLRPQDIVQLMKVSTELERTIKLSKPEKIEGTVADAGKKQQALTKAEDIGEVVGILQASGILDGKILGIKTTSEIVVKEE